MNETTLFKILKKVLLKFIIQRYIKYLVKDKIENIMSIEKEIMYHFIYFIEKCTFSSYNEIKNDLANARCVASG